MTEPSNGKGTIVTPQDVLSEHAAAQRRARKPTLGEFEDVFNEFAGTMIGMYGPLAVELRELRLRVQALESAKGDIE